MKKTAKDILRVGIVGCGGMGRGIHVKEFYLREPRVELAAACDILPERAQAVADAGFPGIAQYADWREMIKDPAIDAIDICTPNDLHSEIAVAALGAGKHVFCEKPDAIDAEKAAAMRDAAAKAGKLLMVMRNNRFTDAARYLKRFVAEGRAGELYAGRCGWQRRRGIPGKGGWFTTKARSGGGPLIDLGVHMIDLAVWLMGSPHPVAVSGQTFRKFADADDVSDSVHSAFGDKVAGGTFDVEDLAMGFVRFDNGAVLQIEFSWASNVARERRFVELMGTKAGFSVEDSQMRIFTEENGELLDIAPPGLQRDDGHVRNLRNFVDAVLEGAEPCYKPQEGVDMIAILEGFYKSARLGREVRL